MADPNLGDDELEVDEDQMQDDDDNIVALNPNFPKVYFKKHVDRMSE